MQYLNPYCLLNVCPGSLEDTPESLKLRKRELISQLSLDGDIQLDGQIIDRPRALGILEDLDSEKKRNYHSRIFRSAELHDFLRFGVISDSLKVPKRPTEFVDFVRPHLLNSFIAAVDRILNESDSVSLAFLFNSPFPFTNDELSKAYRPIRRHFRQLESALSLEYDDFKSGELEYSESWVDGIIPAAQIDCLNELPFELEDLCDDVANALNSIGVVLYNDVEEIVGAQAIFGTAARIRSSAQTKERIVSNLKIADNSVHRGMISTVVQDLKVLNAKVKARKIASSDDIVKSAFALVDPSRLSAIQNPSIDSELIAICKLLQEIGWLCVTSYGSTAAGSVLLNLCLKIELSEVGLTKTLRKKITEVQLAMTHSRINANNKRETSTSANKKSNRTSSGNSDNRQTVSSGFYDTNTFNPTVIEDQGVLAKMRDEIRAVSLGWAVIIVLAVAGFIFFGVYNSKTPDSTTSTQSSNSPSNSSKIGPQTSTSSSWNSNSVAAVKSTPTQTARPKSGTIIEKNKAGGLGRLNISNGLSDDAIVKLRLINSGATIRAVYIRSSSRASVSGIPPGDYEIIVATGYNYSPLDKLFHGSPKYEKMNDTFSYSQVYESGGTRYKIFEIELEKTRHGNLTSSTIDSTEFNK